MIPGFEEIRNQIIQLRKNLDMTQAEVAKKAEVSQSFIAKLESGKSTPNYDAVARLYNTLSSMSRGNEENAVELMNTYVVTVSPDDSVQYASSIMRTENYSQLPVLQNGRQVGSVTGMCLLNVDPDDKVKDHMQPAFPEVPENTSKSAVSELLKSTNAVLVRKQADDIIGIITPSDLI